MENSALTVQKATNVAFVSIVVCVTCYFSELIFLIKVFQDIKNSIKAQKRYIQKVPEKLPKFQFNKVKVSPKFYSKVQLHCSINIFI